METIGKIMAFMAVSLFFASCSEKEPQFGNRLYIDVTAVSEEILFKGSSAAVTEERVLKAGIPRPASGRISAVFIADPSLVDTYRDAYYSPSAEPLPAEYCTVENAEVTIEEEAVSSTEATVRFSGIEKLDMEKTYVMPVAMRNVQGAEVLESKSVVYYVFKGASLINVVADMNENRAWPDFKDSPDFNLAAFTLEALVNFNQFGKQISTIMGIEGKFLLRMGDAAVPDNQLQIATSNGNFTDAGLQMEPGKWYHVALTFDKGAIKVYIDGVEKLTADCGLGAVDFGVHHNDESNGQPRCFWVGYSYNDERSMNGLISEVRMWNRTLTPEEINAVNHFYTAEPAAEGLMAYWKFDEGAGTSVKDHSRYGHDLTVDSEPEWVQVTLPES